MDLLCEHSLYFELEGAVDRQDDIGSRNRVAADFALAGNSWTTAADLKGQLAGLTREHIVVDLLNTAYANAVDVDVTDHRAS